MSAFIVSDATIDALVTFGFAGHDKAAAFEPREAGQILVNENYRSCNARYRGEYGEPPRYMFRTYTQPLTAVEVLKLCNCYDYQACETDDYERTQAAQLIKAISSKAIRLLPGYDAAHWGLPDHYRSDAVSLSSLA